MKIGESPALSLAQRIQALEPLERVPSQLQILYRVNTSTLSLFVMVKVLPSIW